MRVTIVAPRPQAFKGLAAGNLVAEVRRQAAERDVGRQVHAALRREPIAAAAVALEVAMRHRVVTPKSSSNGTAWAV
eukprot:3489433-Alexandrium_andersonii.AAC.1